ncbi:phage portal protein [Lactococcus lactis]|nr:phage portal protein [Lactococcus lactis]MDM7501789.1 phage portal protein [Lactococcus lactis]MDM7520686.1 phage portal protein [Lactococcus lactis]
MVDEYHLFGQKQRDFISSMTSGMVNNPLAQMFFISTAGVDPTVPMFEDYKRYSKMLESGDWSSSEKDLVLIWEQDSEDEAYLIETWPKSNPLMEIESMRKNLTGGMITERDSLNSQGRIRDFYVKNMNLWQNAKKNAYLPLDLVQDAIVELRLIPSNAITIDLTDDTLTYEVNQFDDYPSAKYNASEMIHVKIMAYGVDTLHNLVGHSPLESLTSEIGQQKEANRLSLSTLKGALNPTSVVKVPQGTLSSEAKDSIRKEFEKANGGNNSGRVMVLDQSADFSTVSINADVANYLNSMNWGRTQIAKAFGVSDSYLNGTGDQQSSLDQNKDLYVNALNRFIEPLISELRIKCDSSIGVDMSPITDYSNSVFKADILNWVKEGIIEPTEAKTLLESKGII